MNEHQSPDSAEQLAAIAGLHALLTRHDITYWLFGGWAVDFHVGQLTRPHDDIDVAIWERDRATIAQLVTEHGWTHTPDDGEDGYTAYTHGDTRLEVAYLARDEDGRIYTPIQNGRGEWPIDAFGDDLLELRGVRAHTIRREALMSDKSEVRTDSVTAAKDRADVSILARRDKRW